MKLSMQKLLGEEDLNRSNKLLDRLDKVSADSVRYFARKFLSADTPRTFA